MRNRNKRARQIKAILLFGVILILILMLIVSTVGRRQFNATHKITLELIGTAQSGVTSITGFFSSVWDGYIALVNVHDENLQLRLELEKAIALNNEYREAAATNFRLFKLLDLKKSLPPPTLTARIVGKDPSLWFKTVIINKGSSDGVKQGMPVVTVEGIVGQIMSASPNYAKVLLATDPNSAIDVIVQRTRTKGIIKGDGANYQLHYVLKNLEINEGDAIVTSGLDGVFPNGLQVGTVTKITESRRGMFQKIDIKPSVDLSQLEYLIIIMKENSLAE